MIDPKALLPEVQKLLPSVPPQEIMDGIKQFIQAHPDADSNMALRALTAYLKQGGGQSAPTPASGGQPFEGLMSQLGAH